MNPKTIFLSALCAVAMCAPIYAQDIEGASDHPDIGRYEGTVITHFETIEYDSQRMFTNVDPAEFSDFEGAVTRIIYSFPEGASVLQIARSFEQKLTGEGFDVLVSCRDRDCGRALFGDLSKTLWLPTGVRIGALSSSDIAFLSLERESEGSSSQVQIGVVSGNAGSGIFVSAVESAAFENRVLDAAAMAESISDTGRVSLDNIYFDFNEATLKPESGDALTEMARLLADNPNIDVYIVGHTDNVGGYEFNLDLSRRRAQAVVDALVSQHGVDPARVVPAGVGPLAPIASNAASDGQAQNRRVELVQR